MVSYYSISYHIMYNRNHVADNFFAFRHLRATSQATAAGQKRGGAVGGRINGWIEGAVSHWNRPAWRETSRLVGATQSL